MEAQVRNEDFSCIILLEITISTKNDLVGSVLVYMHGFRPWECGFTQFSVRFCWPLPNPAPAGRSLTVSIRYKKNTFLEQRGLLRLGTGCMPSILEPQTHKFALTSQTALALLDLPDLAMECIAQNLSLLDLASCMLCCRTLHTLLRPRQTTLVRARSLGSRWVLRACGRALFSDLASRYKAGMANFEYHESSAHLFYDRCVLGQHVAENGQRHFQTIVRMKASAGFPGPQQSQWPLISASDLSWFFYVSTLAVFRGFRRIAGVMEKAWEQAVLPEEQESFGYDVPWSYQRRKAIQERFLVFRPTKCFPMPFFSELYCGGAASNQHLKFGRDLRVRLEKAVRNCLGAEALSTVYYVIFLQTLYNPLAMMNFEPDGGPTIRLVRRFRHALDVTVE